MYISIRCGQTTIENKEKWRQAVKEMQASAEASHEADVGVEHCRGGVGTEEVLPECGGNGS